MRDTESDGFLVDGFLVDAILDQAGQKGTGRWTSRDALDLGTPIPTIDAAVWSRHISALKDARVAAAAQLRPGGAPRIECFDGLVECVRQALYAAKVCSYAQGMSLLRAASEAYAYDLKPAELARIWKGGCIIRARLLGDIQRAFNGDPSLVNLLLDEQFRTQLAQADEGWRRVVTGAKSAGLPFAAMSASLDYYDAYRSDRLPHEPHAGSAGLLRRAHLPARRPPGRIPYAVGARRRHRHRNERPGRRVKGRQLTR